jgi:hypothetical protein
MLSATHPQVNTKTHRDQNIGMPVMHYKFVLTDITGMETWEFWAGEMKI